MIRRFLIAGLVAGLVAATGLIAMPARAAGDPPFITIGLGGIGVVADREKTGVVHFEYRSDWEFWKVRPFIGAFATTDASLYGYFGFKVDMFFGRRIVITPNVAVGAYEDGDGQDLGHVIEFRSGVEFAWRFDDRSRLGVAVHHLSNTSIGTDNPGTEEIVLFYSLPLNSLFSD